MMLDRLVEIARKGRMSIPLLLVGLLLLGFVLHDPFEAFSSRPLRYGLLLLSAACVWASWLLSMLRSTVKDDEFFPDGAALWASGPQRFVYMDAKGSRFQIEVRGDQQSPETLLILYSSIRSIKGGEVSAEMLREILHRAQTRFTADGKLVRIV